MKIQIPGQVVALESAQADEIRQMTVITFSLTMTLSLFGIEVPVNMVGRKVSKREWWIYRGKSSYRPERLQVVYESQ